MKKIVNYVLQDLPEPVLVLGIVLLGFVMRLIFFPFAQIDNADAVERVYIAYQWAENPHWITSGTWGPLHFYLIGTLLLFWKDLILAPGILQMALSSLGAAPLYFFTKTEFGKREAVLAALLYIFYPVILHNSYFSISEIPFTLLLLLSLPFIAAARKEEGTPWHALLGGVFLMLAGAIRYEAWLLIPLLGILLWRKWRSLIVFGLVNAIFPIYWVISNYLATGDPLYFLNWRTNWMTLEGFNTAVTFPELMHREVQLLSTIFWGLTPVVFFFCCAGIFLSLRKHDKTSVWLIPAGGMLILFTIMTFQGSLLPTAKYTIPVAVILFPYVAYGFYGILDHFKAGLSGYHRAIVAAFLLLSMIPFSFIGRLPVFSSFVPLDVQAIPRILRESRQISAIVNQGLFDEDAFVADFWSWDYYYIALMTRLPPTAVFLAPGAKFQTTDLSKLVDFFNEHTGGVIVIANEQSRLAVDMDAQNLEGFISSSQAQKIKLKFSFLGETSSVKVYRYKVSP